ncbi:hypothetical protein [Halapricum desulfuricans]|uniref:Uncharacterized protein n=1 Tax=Halapricum desulfuricans TaxID=2841257 RepID=A0A897NE38_9EURY|nr:hypothetical protein [Halapricum desulfuricans]QSG09293.1 Uncharacterized protein HSR122_1908 [Halapricum desulfuricans]
MATTMSTQHTAPFTISEADSDAAPETGVVTQTKRYTFYWLVGEEPILLTVKDYDGTNVTGEVDPPDRMIERVAQSG